MMESIQERLKMEFSYYNRFPAIAKLIVALYSLHVSKSRANITVDILRLLIYSHSKCAISKECVL